MSHRRTKERLSAYMERELPALEHARVRAHLAECVGCRAELEELERVVALLRALPDPEPPVSLAGEVLLDIERHPPGAFSRLGGWMREHLGGGALSPLSAAAVAVALLAWVQLADPEATELPTSGLGSGMSASGKPGPSEGSLSLAARAPALPSAERRLVGASADPGSVPAPTMPRHFAECRTQGTADAADECAELYYSWLISQAHEDPPGFARAAAALPQQRFQGLRSFAVRSGSGPLVWRSLQDGGDPRARHLASQLVQRASAQR